MKKTIVFLARAWLASAFVLMLLGLIALIGITTTAMFGGWVGIAVVVAITITVASVAIVAG